ncbi:MAG: hypothetical protein ABH875_01135 [Candidatus Omnitrophota bacterium]
MKKIFLICAVIVVLTGCAVLAIDPGFADVLYDEDNLFENLTTIIFAIALIFSLYLFLKGLIGGKAYRLWLSLSVILIVFIGDELSWGIMHRGLEPRKIAGVDFDGLHDILSIGVSVIKHIRDYIFTIGISDARSILIILSSAIISVFAAYLIVKLVIRKKSDITSFFSRNMKWEPFFFLVLSFALLAPAMFVDEDNLVNFPHKAVAEESIELLASVAILLACLSGLRVKKDV